MSVIVTDAGFQTTAGPHDFASIELLGKPAPRRST